MGEAVGAWLESLGLGEYAESFADNRIDMDVLPELTADDLKDIGVRAVGDRRKLLGAIERLGEAPADVPLEIESFDASRRQVTVLFADISGYTALTHGLDAEDTHAILNRYFDAVDGVVRGHGGRIDKHIGDAVMAVFGAPIARTDDPERALRAALEIHDVVARLEPPIAVHIGVASGQVVASTTGSAAHGEYTVTGDSVNLAARLTDLAASGETYAADDMRRALGGRFAGEELGPRAIEGLDEPVIVWRLDAVALGARRRFVGRERELALFSAAFATAASHRAGTVFVLRGEPGIGKTHMLEEIANLGRGAGFTLLHGLTLDFGAAGGQSPVDGIVRDLLGIAGEGGKSARERAVDAVVGEGWIEEADRVHLNNMLDLDQEAGRSEAYAVMDNATRVLGRQRVVASLVAARAASAPLLIEIEDVHWAAPEVLAQFARLAAVVAELSAILVMTTRIVGDPIDDGFRAEADGVSIMTIDLPPLRAEEARRLAEDYTSVDPALLASCVSRSGGNPLFLEQLLRNLDELSADNLPGSIQGIVQARLDVLDNENRGAIQAASVMGQRFDPDALAHLLKREGFDPATLLRAALLRRAGADLHFAHALIRDGAYESLLKARRLELHRRAADWFAGRDPALHARHLDLAADAGAAAAYLMAVRHHAEVFQYDQAFSLADRGLELDAPAPTRFELVCTKGDLLRAIGRSAEAIELLGEKAASASGHEQTARMHIALAHAARQASRYDDALASLEIAEAAAAALEAPLDLATIHYLRGNVYFPLGRIDKCLESSERAFHFARAAD